MAAAPVQSDKTKESMAEILKEFNEIIGSRPPSVEEVAKVKKNMMLELPGRWETNNAIMGSLSEMVRNGWPEDYFQNPIIYPPEEVLGQSEFYQEYAPRVLATRNRIFNRLLQ